MPFRLKFWTNTASKDQAVPIKAPIILRVTFTGLMLALVLLFQYLEQLMPFGNFGFVNFNLSLAFILITLSVAGWKFSALLLVLRFVLGPLLSGKGYAPLSVIGQIILLVAGILAISIYQALSLVKPIARHGLFARHFIKAGLSIVIVSVIMALLNAVLFVPWYFANYSGEFKPPLPLSDMPAQYNERIRVFYFYIPNYWAGVFSVYLVFNFINLLINFTMHYLMLNVTAAYRPVSTY